MYSTGIGIVIETIARFEHDEFLKSSQASDFTKYPKPTNDTAETADTDETEDPNEEKDNKGPKKPRKKIDLTKIVTSFTQFFTPEDID